VAIIELNPEAIQALAAEGLKQELLKDKTFQNTLLTLLTQAIQKDAALETRGFRDDIHQAREAEKESAIKNMSRSSEEIVATGKSDLQKHINSRIHTEMNQRWYTPTREGIEAETKKIIQDTVHRSFHRTAHVLAQTVLTSNDSRLKELLDAKDLEEFKEEIVRNVGTEAAKTADRILGSHMARLSMLMEEDVHTDEIREALKRKK